MDIDLHDLRAGIQQAGAAEGQPVVDALAKNHNQIGLLEGLLRGAVQGRVPVAEAQGIEVGDGAPG